MKKRIMFADDHPVFLIGLRAVLSSTFSNSYQISGEVHSVDQLLARLEEEVPDVLLTDFNMPGEQQSDGVRLITTLRRKYPELPIVVVTVLTHPGLVNSILAMGVHAVINKRSLTTELTACLKDLLLGRRPAVTHLQETSIAMSPRELDVIRLLAQGYSVNSIASLLNRTKQTISTQKKSAMNKIGVNSDAELFEYLHHTGMAQ